MVLVLAAAVAPAAADITRGCSASLDVYVVDGSLSSADQLGTIEGRGGCSNKAHANDCRARARAEIDRCRNDLWNGRQVNAIPASCRSIVQGSSRSGAKLSYDGILVYSEPNRLMARAARAACCQLRPNADKLNIQIGGRITGDKKCASTKIGKDNYQDEYGYPKYEMSCKAWRAKGICGN
jgi:hypothetical protein